MKPALPVTSRDLFQKSNLLKQQYSFVLDRDRPLAMQYWETAEQIKKAAQALEFLEGLEMDAEDEERKDVGFGKNGVPL